MAIVEFETYKSELEGLKPSIEELEASLDLSARQDRITELERQMEEPNFWDDAQNSTKIVKELKSLKDTVGTFNAIVSLYEEVETMIEMGSEAEDEELAAEAGETLKKLKTDIETERTAQLLSGEYDANNAILALSAGAGGTEAMDFNEMLYRMYSRWCDKHGFKIKVMDYQEGDEAGIKGVTFTVEGENAYGLLKSEAGVHRLVRISPFNAQGKRQTSFVSCDVMP